MAKIDDLHRMLTVRADEVSDVAPDVGAAIGRAGRRRTARRAAVGLGAVGAAAVIALPFLVDLGGGVEQPGPRATSTAGQDEDFEIPPEGGWMENLPGLDLPQGDGLDVPYAVDSSLFASGTTYEFGGPIIKIIDAPEGLVVLSFDAPLAQIEAQTGEDPTSTITLVAGEGDAAARHVLGNGFIAQLSAGATSTGATRIAWAEYGASRSYEAGELRSMVLGSADPPAVLPGVSDLFVLDVDRGDVRVHAQTSDDSTIQIWYPDDGTLVPFLEPAEDTYPLAIGVAGDPGLGVFTTFGEGPACTFVAPVVEMTNRVWERCDDMSLQLSSDRMLGTDGYGVLDMRTGDLVVALGLDVKGPTRASAEALDELVARPMGWAGDSVLINVSYTIADAVHTVGPSSSGDGTYTYSTPVHVVASCSASDGTCERLPHDVGVVAVPLLP